MLRCYGYIVQQPFSFISVFDSQTATKRHIERQFFSRKSSAQGVRCCILTFDNSELRRSMAGKKNSVSGASRRGNGNSSQPANGHPKKGKKRNRQLQEGTKALEETMKSTVCNTSEFCECPKSKSVLAEKSDIIRAQSLKIKNLEGVVCALQRQNQEASKQLESLRMLGKKDEATILRRAKKIAMLDAVISKHSIDRQALLSKINCLNCDMKILEASRNAHATDCKNLIDKIQQQDEIISGLSKARATDNKNLIDRLEQQEELIRLLNTENVQLFKKVDFLEKKLQESKMAETLPFAGPLGGIGGRGGSNPQGRRVSSFVRGGGNKQ